MLTFHNKGNAGREYSRLFVRSIPKSDGNDDDYLSFSVESSNGANLKISPTVYLDPEQARMLRNEITVWLNDEAKVPEVAYHEGSLSPRG